MKLALFSDLHANLEAFEACLAHAQAAGASDIAILGDLVGYGPQPAELVERCRTLQAQGAIVLQGNHDALAALTTSPDAVTGGAARSATSWAELTADFTRTQLSDAQRAWLAELPFTHTLGTVLLVHATADAPERWSYADDPRVAARSLEAACANPEIRHVLGGHVHQQQLYYRGTGRALMPFQPRAGVSIPVGRHRSWLATVGSTGQPRDGDPRAAYALIDLARATLTFYRVAYDVGRVCRAIRAKGLPPILAERLESGR